MEQGFIMGENDLKDRVEVYISNHGHENGESV